MSPALPLQVRYTQRGWVGETDCCVGVLSLGKSWCALSVWQPVRGARGPHACAGDDEGAGGGAGEALLLTSTGASSLGAGPGLRASPILRKLAVKLASRTGLAYLPPKVAAWR